jgi:Putative stage IV sporulation protein YqfD.
MGYDQFYIEEEYLLSLLKYVRKKHLKIHFLKKYDEGYMFYASTFQRFLWKDMDISLEYIKTIGLMKYFLYFKGLNSVMIIIGFVLGLFVFSHLIFDIKIIGSIPHLNTQIIKTLNKEQINHYSRLRDFEELNDILMSLKNKYKKSVEYLNIYQRGSVFYVEYTNKAKDELEKSDFRNIYAKKDGMIESFDVDSGMIKVKRLDYVKKGDLLIENTLISTDKKSKIIPVKGHVYAYTFNTYQASVKNTGQDQGSVFYELLLKIRSSLPANVEIDKENVLQIDRKRSKITLIMHYTLLEDIAIKKEK